MYLKSVLSLITVVVPNNITALSTTNILYRIFHYFLVKFPENPSNDVQLNSVGITRSILSYKKPKFLLHIILRKNLLF
jgi:hypothetical protein